MHKGLGGHTAGTAVCNCPKKYSKPYSIMLSNKTGQRWRLVQTAVALDTNQFVVRKCLLLYHLCFLTGSGGGGGRREGGVPSSLLFFTSFVLLWGRWGWGGVKYY